MSLEELELGTPITGDKLFISGEGLNYDYASINQTRGILNHHSEFLIVEGYKTATVDLLNSLIQDDKIDWLKIDSKIYPIMFVFRHYLEMSMKSTLRFYNMLNDKTTYEQVGYIKEHSLEKLWKDLRPYLEKTFENYQEDLRSESISTLTAVEALLAEFDSLDKNSFGFRYAFAGVKKPEEDVKFSLPSFTIDLNNLRQVILKCINFFDGINMQVEAMLDEKQSNY